ncbi:MAG: multidrug DMT transporter permease [Legionellaceae bacterium]|nr:multidrug DMT transporter permease [Legionellaceae bacterium]
MKFMVFRLMSFGLGFFLFANNSFATDDVTSLCKLRHCMLIVDAGSTGSRAHLYAYDLDKQENVSRIDELYVKKISPGFADIEPKKEQVNTYLSTLLAQVPEQDIPVYFYATAGMRLLPIQKQQDLYRILKEWFWTQPQWKLIEARTISGSEEGVFGWLGLNYQLDLLQQPDEQSLASFIEIGGASVQVVFPIEKLDNINKQDIIGVTINGRRVLLFAHSFLGLGATEIAKKFENTGACYPVGFSLVNGEIAQGDALNCQQDITQIINQNNAISSITNIARENNPTSLWYTVGNASFLAKKSPEYFPNGQITPQNMLNYVDTTYCHQDWQFLQKQYETDPYLAKNCLSGVLYYALTVSGYGFDPDQIINTMPAGKDGDWTLGVLLQQPQSDSHIF